MEKNEYFKSWNELVEGDEYFTQLEKWETNEMGEYVYTGNYVSNQQLETLQNTPQQDIVDILKTTHNIPVKIENKTTLFQDNAVFRVDEYLQRQQKIIKELLENTHKSSQYYKKQLEIELDSLAGFLSEKLDRREHIDIQIQDLIISIQEVIYKDLTYQIKNYSREKDEYHPFILQIEHIRVLVNNFLRIYPKKTNNIVIDDDYNIPAILNYARKYIHAYHFPPKVDNNKKYEVIQQDREKLMYTMNRAIFADPENLNPNIFSLFQKIIDYINSIHKRPTTKDEKAKIARTINSYYKDFCKETYPGESLADKVLALKSFWTQSDNIINRSLSIKEYKYDNVSPLSPLGLFLSLKDQLSQSHNKEDELLQTHEQTLDNIVKALGEFESEDFREFDNQELTELERLLYQIDQAEGRIVMAKITKIR